MGVRFDCRLRTLTATFRWRWREPGALEAQWLEVSLFDKVWDPQSGFAQRVWLGPEVASFDLPLETDSVYYWRIRADLHGQVVESPTRQIHTPNCVADFVDQ